MSDPMILRARVAAPVKNVQHALTDADALRAWLAEHAEVELPERFAFWGRYTPEGDAPHQRLLYADDQSLSFSWLLGGVDTTVEISWEAEDTDSTIVTLSQSDFDMRGDDDRREHPRRAADLLVADHREPRRLRRGPRTHPQVRLHYARRRPARC